MDEKTKAAILSGSVGAVAGSLAGYFFGHKKGVEEGEINVFTNHGMPTDMNEILTTLQVYGMSTEEVDFIEANLTLWEAQLFLASYTLAAQYGITL